MALLYFFETSVDYHGMTSKELYQLWLKHAGAAFKLYEQGIMKYAFKICGERKVLGVMSVESPSVLDTCFANLPLYQSIGDQLHTRFTPLRQYEGFASDVCERAGKEDRYEEQKAILKKGLLYFLEFTVEYDPGMTQQDLLTVWAEEGKAALDAKKSGIILDLWKVVAQRKVVAVVCMQDPAEVDRLSLDLPIMKKMGDRVHVECKSIRPIEEWVEDLKKLAE